MIVAIPIHKLLSLTIQNYWKYELEDVSKGELKTDRQAFRDVVYNGGIIEFQHFICNNTSFSSYCIPFILELINDSDNTGGLNIDDVPDSVWSSIQNQLKTDLLGWNEK